MKLTVKYKMSEKVIKNPCINHHLSTMLLLRRFISLGFILQILGSVGELLSLRM